MSNLGFQWVYRLFNRIPDVVCERFFHEEGQPAVTFETGTPLSEFGLLAWSLSWEMDIVHILRTLSEGRDPGAARGARRAAPAPSRRRRHRADEPGRARARSSTSSRSGDGERLVPRIAELLMSGLDRDGVPRGGGAALPGLLRAGGPGRARRGGRERQGRHAAADVAQGHRVPSSRSRTRRSSRRRPSSPTSS